MAMNSFVLVRLDEATKDALRDAAREEERSESAVARRALAAWLKEQGYFRKEARKTRTRRR